MSSAKVTSGVRGCFFYLLFFCVSLLPKVLESLVAGSFSQPEEHRLEQNTWLTTLDTLAREWRISFQFNPEKYSNDDSNLIYLEDMEGMEVISINMNEAGIRPIWLPAKRLVGKQIGKFFVTEDLPPIGKWTMMEFGQQEEDGKFTFYISIDGKVLSARTSQPKEFYNVKVYASTSYAPAQPGSIRNLTVESKLEGKTLLSPSSFPGCGVKMRWEDGTCITSCKYEQKCETKYEQKCETKYEQQCQTAYEEQCAPKCIKVSDWFGENKWLILFP